MVWQWINSLIRDITDDATDNTMAKMLKDKYTDNMLMVLSVMKRVSFFDTMELWMRSTQGKVLERPLGTHLHLSPWESLLLNPVHLHRFPVDDQETIDTGVTIGPRASKPLKLHIPIYITGMSYGSALSKEAKVALAQAATEMRTATNTGESALLYEERQSASRLIGQYNRGGYLNQPEKYRQLDAVEIQLGQGAQGSSPQRTQARFIDREMRQVYGLQEGQDSVLHSRIPGVDNVQDFINLVKKLKNDVEVPVGVKVAASQFLENELAIAIQAGVDFVTVDGAEGGSHAASPTSEDNLGLPTIYAIARARRFLDSQGQKHNISLLAGGGLFTPGHFLKALALGADAVYIGTAAILALVAQQMTRVTPTEPPTQLVLATGLSKDKFNPTQGADSLINFLKVSVQEMSSVMYSLGKTAISQLNTEDLCCLDPWLARALNVAYAGVAQSEQASFYHDMNIAQWNQAAQVQPHVH
ncbi:MAG: FMN-binding glutamate synthase family protein [Bacillota bacterium]